MTVEKITADLTRLADRIDNRIGPISGHDADVLALALRRIGGEVQLLNIAPGNREIRDLRMIDALRKLIADLSEALTDEGGDWSPVGLDELRHRVGNALPPDECPDWLWHYRDPV